MILTVKVAFDMEIVKLATFFCENSSSDHAQTYPRNRVKIMSK